MVALECFYCYFLKRLALQNANPNCFAVINNGVMVLNLKSVVPIKTLFEHGKRHFALHKCLVLMSTNKTTSLFDQKSPPQTASNSIRNSVSNYPLLNENYRELNYSLSILVLEVFTLKILRNNGGKLNLLCICYILRGNKMYTVFGFEYWVLCKWLR